MNKLVRYNFLIYLDKPLKMLPNSPHFFIEIAEQNKTFVLRAGQFHLDAKGYFTKHFLAENGEIWEEFWLVFQKNYPFLATENKADVLFYVHGLWSGSDFQVLKNLKWQNDFYTQNLNSPIAVTISIIWHTGYRPYYFTRYLCKKRAKAFASFFWNFTYKMKSFLKNQRFNGENHLLCHSMGNYFLENMLQYKPNTEGPLFKEFVMAAADVGNDFIEKYPLEIQYLSHRTLALNNQNDRSLSVSKWLNQQTRLGKHPPPYFKEKEPFLYATEVSGVRDVTNIIGLFNQHQHHQVSEKVKVYLCGIFRGEKMVEVL
jgi:Alpha/beta hydrolase of unknown function (DUF900)